MTDIGKAHQYKAGQWYCFEITTAGRLHVREHPQCRLNGSTTYARKRPCRRSMMKLGLANRHQCRHRIADDRHARQSIPFLRQPGGFEWKCWHFIPRYDTSQRAIGQNRSDESLVSAIALAQ